jgi:hypothetical protein
MMTLPDIQAALERVSYKPGWRFHVAEHPREGLLIRIEADVPDSASDGSLTLGINSWLPPMYDETQLVSWLRWRICRVELHEAAEFLRVDGRVLDDPHSGACPWLEAAA